MKKAIIIFVLILCGAIIFLLDPFEDHVETPSETTGQSLSDVMP